MVTVKIPNVAATCEKSKQSEIFMKLNLRTESHERGQEDVECEIGPISERIETDAQYPAITRTLKRGNEDQSVDDNSKAYRSENDDALKAKIGELKKENSTLSSVVKKTAESCRRLKIENKNLLQELKKICSKDEISRLEATNPPGNSQSVDDDEEHYQTTSKASDDFNTSADLCSDIGDSDPLPLLQLKKE
ncbi:uncharacterized protein LOC132064995 [Lycium ferocissimum]|uniref:uncharacterized protein LOC132064995 n=1 Tax=Lycium ferocissimum TaxID=112874 RepID=UPI0028154DDA|nr:uncharacterized protein LOC132064995 [Lycium ferocissimum]